MQTLTLLAHTLLGERDDLWCWIVRGTLLIGAIPPVLKSILDLSARPDVRAIGRWVAATARRVFQAITAALEEPGPRKPQPPLDMTLKLATCTVDYLFSLYFVLWFFVVIVIFAQHQATLTPSKICAFALIEGGFALIGRFYLVHGARQRLQLVECWRTLQGHRWSAAAAMACVPTSMVLVAVAATLV